MPIRIKRFVQLLNYEPTKDASDIGIETELTSELFLEPELCVFFLWT